MVLRRGALWLEAESLSRLWEDFRLRNSHATRWSWSKDTGNERVMFCLRIARLVLRGCPARPFFAGPTAQVGPSSLA